MTQSARRVLLGITVAAALASHSMVSKAQTAATTRQFQRVSASGPFQAGFLPRALDQTPVTVVAILGGPSVADAEDTAGRRLTRQEKDALKAQRRAEQAGPRAAIQGLGGRVLGSFQSALNGVKVSIPRNQVAALRQIAGVVDVKPVATYKIDTFIGVQRIQAPLAWAGVAGVHGENIKIGIIDTGIDYTHANFGGPGTTDAYQAALAADTAPPDPTLIGAAAPRIKGGIDLVGDDYDANDPNSTPVPDPNPLDCNGHGSHVAGIAGGSGVLTSGTTFTGPYDQLTHSTHSFLIGPGVAPKADLYAIRVFGCSGSTNVVNEAIDWAVDNDMDVINMSLGASFGSGDSADSLAADNAMKAGVMVVMSAGNSGPVPYILGSPGSSRKGIAVAATDDPAFVRQANIPLPAVASDPNSRTITAINANGVNLPGGALQIKVLLDPSGAVSLGCDPAQFVAAGVVGKIVVVQRGICARVAKAINGQKAGAAVVVMINNATSLPPFEGEIVQNPDNGEVYTVTIPFLGVRGLVTTPNSDGFFLAQRDGQSTTLSEGVALPTGTASFSSSGPRIPDGLLKPDVAAPGVNIVSTGIGTGNGSLTISGTSMAAPFVTGTAALVVQAHPNWKTAAVKSAILNTGDAGGLGDYVAQRDGTGIINAAGAVGTQVYAFGDKDETTINFGVQEFGDDFSKTRTITLKNDSRSDASFNISVAHQSGSPHNVVLSSTSLTVPARGQRAVNLRLTVPAGTAGDTTSFRDLAGLVTFTPASAASNRGIALNVAYYLVPRVTANVTVNLAKLKGNPPSGTAIVANLNSPIAATADFYAWGLAGAKDHLGSLDLHAAGVQSIDVGVDRILVFAINTFRPWSAVNTSEFDVLIDTDGDGNADFDLFGVDIGLVDGTGDFTGEYIAAIFDIHTGALSADFDAYAPTDGSTLLLPVFAADVGITAANPRFTYSVTSNSVFDSSVGDELPGSARFNAFAPAISNGMFLTLVPGDVQTIPISVSPAEFALTPSRGLMVVTQDNKNGAAEANLVNVKF